MDTQNIQNTLDILNKNNINYSMYEVDNHSGKYENLSVFDSKGNLTRKGQMFVNSLYQNPATFIKKSSLPQDVKYKVTSGRIMEGQPYTPLTIQGINKLIQILGKR